jgi:ferrous iron transport protein A
MPLTSAPGGHRVELLSLPSNAALQRRLTAMGIKPGCILQVLRRGQPGGILHVACGVLEFMIRHDQAKDMEIATLNQA